MKKAEKYLAAGAIVAAAATAATLCPVLAPHLKIAAIVGCKNVFKT